MQPLHHATNGRSLVCDFCGDGRLEAPLSALASTAGWFEVPNIRRLMPMYSSVKSKRVTEPRAQHIATRHDTRYVVA